MAKRKVSPDPAEAQRRRLAEAAEKLCAIRGPEALHLAWTSLLFVWEAASGLREEAGEFWVNGATVREFLATLRSTLRNTLPREVADVLGKADANGPAAL
jgi:hypothetical protein